MGKRRDGVYQTAEQWLKVRHNRSMAHIAGFPVLLLITVLGIMIPLDTMPHSTPGNVLAAVFGIIGGVGFIINFIAFFVWADS
jgi:fumarate reductase subunit D